MICHLSFSPEEKLGRLKDHERLVLEDLLLIKVGRDKM